MYKKYTNGLLLIILTTVFILDGNHLPVRPDQLMLDYVGVGKHYYVQFLKTFKGERYLVKQKNNTFSDTNKALQALREVTGAHIAHEHGIQSQQVWIIPTSMQFPGKIYEKKPATLHAIVPGKIIKDSHWHHLNIRQKDQAGKDYVRGLSLAIIKQLPQHKDLPLIVGLDTFTGNGGRHNDNFFYEAKTDSFWIIDMGGAFKKNYVSESAKNIEQLLTNKKLKLSQKEIEALQLYRDTLEQLYKAYSGMVMEALLNRFIEQADIDFYTGESIKNLILKHLEESCNDIPHFLHVLDTLIQR